MKNYFTLILNLFLTSPILAQPSILWQKTLGGSQDEFLTSYQHASDGGTYLAGNTYSNDGDVTGYHNQSDVWVVKLKESGDLQWQKTLGGSAADAAPIIRETRDSGVVVMSQVYSTDGDVLGNHGKTDIWVVKLDKTGFVEWQTVLGGSSFEFSVNIEQTPDNGFLLAGSTYSLDGDVIDIHGDQDYWLVKLKEDGDIAWQRTLGGLATEYLQSMILTSDGGSALLGVSSSNDNDVSGNHGGGDIWVVKMDSLGAIQWQKALGGSGAEYATSVMESSTGGLLVSGTTNSHDGDVTDFPNGYDLWVVQFSASGNIEWQQTLGSSADENGGYLHKTADGGYILNGNTSGSDGDVSGFHGLNDAWLVKLSATGALEWQKAVGGSNYDLVNSVNPAADGSLILAGETISTNGDATGNQGNYDAWIIKLDANGNTLWHKTAGGAEYDAALFATALPDGRIVVAGNAISINGDVVGNHGQGDFWVFTLKALASGTEETVSFDKVLEMFPNPASQAITIHVPGASGILTVRIADPIGRLYSTQTITNETQMNVSNLPEGIYFLQVETESGEVFSGKFRRGN